MILCRQVSVFLEIVQGAFHLVVWLCDVWHLLLGEVHVNFYGWSLHLQKTQMSTKLLHEAVVTIHFF